jgi:hypothetical protein
MAVRRFVMAPPPWNAGIAVRIASGWGQSISQREAAMRARLLPLFALCLLAAPVAAASADSLQENTDEAERLAGEALAKMMRALDLLIMTVPRYAPPEVLPNGDIIIRRLDPQEDEDEPIETGGDDGIET